MTMKPIALLAIAAAALAGCSETKPAEQGSEQVPAALNPGEYEVTTQVESLRSTDQTTPATKIKAMAGSGSRGNARELNRFMSALSPDERADVAATLAAGLGRRSVEEPFSPGTFITNVRNIDERSRIVLFGKDGARSIQNLMKLAQAKKDTVGRLNNSRSGQVFNYRTVLSNLVLGVPGGGAVAGALTGIGGATMAGAGLAVSGAMLGGSRALAKALMNPEFTRLVANAPATSSPKAIDRHIGMLRKLAVKDANVRSVVQGLEQKMLSFANDNFASRAAADDSVSDDQQSR